CLQWAVHPVGDLNDHDNYRCGVQDCDDNDPGVEGDDCPQCGDGDVDGGEECDDGNQVSGDGCSGTCKDEYCGDGIITPVAPHNEQCDYDGLDTASCDHDCTLVECGDGYINEAADETCDDTLPGFECPTSCDDGDACTTDTLSGSAASCTAECVNDP